MSLLTRVSVSLTEAWTATYTAGLPHGLKQGRRDEVRYDLWEQQREARLDGNRPLSTALHVLVRLLLGVPADIFWRSEVGSVRGEEKRGMTDSLTTRLLLFGAVVIALVPAVMGATVLAGNGDLSSSERAVFGSLSMVVGVLMAAGLMLSRSSPRVGLGLVILGAVGIAILWFWAFFITIPIGLGLIWLAHRRGKGLDRPHGTGLA